MVTSKTNPKTKSESPGRVEDPRDKRRGVRRWGHGARLLVAVTTVALLGVVTPRPAAAQPADDAATKAPADPAPDAAAPAPDQPAPGPDQPAPAPDPGAAAPAPDAPAPDAPAPDAPAPAPADAPAPSPADAQPAPPPTPMTPVDEPRTREETRVEVTGPDETRTERTRTEVTRRERTGSADRATTKAGPADAGVGRGRTGDLFTGLHLSRNEWQTGDEKVGGLFSFIRGSSGEKQGSKTYAADAYLRFNPAERDWTVFENYPDLVPYAFFEAHVASDKDDAEDNIRFGAAVSYDRDVSGTRLFGHEITDLITDVSLRYEADRDFETEQIILRLAFSADAPTLGVGDSLPDRETSAHFNWRPIVGLELGPKLDERENAPDEEAPPFRAFVDLRAQVKFDYLRDRLGLADRPFVFAQNKFQYVAGEGANAGRNLFVLGFEVPLTENVGFQIVRKYGRDAPQFDRVDSIQLGLSVKF